MSSEGMETPALDDEDPTTTVAAAAIPQCLEDWRVPEFSRSLLHHSQEAHGLAVSGGGVMPEWHARGIGTTRPGEEVLWSPSGSARFSAHTESRRSHGVRAIWEGLRSGGTVPLRRAEAPF